MQPGREFKRGTGRRSTSGAGIHALSEYEIVSPFRLGVRADIAAFARQAQPSALSVRFPVVGCREAGPFGQGRMSWPR